MEKTLEERAEQMAHSPQRHRHMRTMISDLTLEQGKDWCKVIKDFF